jgi:hypothetical protein
LSSPAVSDLTSAAAGSSLSPPSAPPVSDREPRHGSDLLETLPEHGSSSSPARKRALLQPAVAASAFAAAPTDLASRSADVPIAEPTTRPAQPSLIPRPRTAARPFTGICGADCWWATSTLVPSGMATGPSASDPVTLPPTVSDTLLDSEAKLRH